MQATSRLAHLDGLYSALDQYRQERQRIQRRLWEATERRDHYFEQLRSKPGQINDETAFALENLCLDVVTTRRQLEEQERLIRDKEEEAAGVRQELFECKGHPALTR